MVLVPLTVPVLVPVLVPLTSPLVAVPPVPEPPAPPVAELVLPPLDAVMSPFVPPLAVLLPPVWVTVIEGKNAVEVLVDDDGPGIPPAERENVFRPFFRLEPSRNPETGGTGLGLAIARDVARGHGGDILLEDSPQGGLRARLRLPK